MTMPANQINTYSNFYLKVAMCYNTHCRDVEVPWVNDLTSLPKLADIAVLDNRSGRWKPGLYVRTDLQTWRIAMDYEDVCNLLLNANAVKVVNFAGYTEEMTAGYILFKNGQRMEVGVITPSEHDIYVSVFLEAEFRDLTSVVTKASAASSANVLQVSGGADKTIKDWVPASGGMVKVDSEGHPAVAVRGVDYETQATGSASGVVQLATEDQAVSTSDTTATTPAYVSKAIGEATLKAADYPTGITDDSKATTGAYVEEAIQGAIENVRVEVAEFPDVANDTGLTTPAYVDAAVESKKVGVSQFPDITNDVGFTTPSYVNEAITTAVGANLTRFGSNVTDRPIDAPVVDITDPSLNLLVAGVRTNALALRTIRSLGGVALGYAVMGSKA